MNTNSFASPEGFAGKLGSEAVLKAIDELWGLDRSVGSQLQRSVQRLLAAADWSTEPERLQRLGLQMQYFAGTLQDVLRIPGDLILLRTAESDFALLQRMEQNWQYLGQNGSALPDDVLTTGSDRSVEAAVLRLPKKAIEAGTFASLAALWPQLRAAWAEVGIASLFINAGQLLLPVFALLVYDKIALNGLFETLWALVLGIAIYLAADTGMRLVRSWATERIGADLARRSDESLWAKMVAQIDLPAGGFSRFLSNYRDLTLSRDFVSSSYLLSIADIPFLFLYLVVIGIISWPLMIVVLLLALLYAGSGLLLQFRQNNLSKEAEARNTQKLSFMGEALGCLDIVRTAPGSGAFLRNWRELTAEAVSLETRKRLAIQQTGLISSIMQTVTTVFMLTTGVYLIYAQLLSIGGLIACNLLAGRAMALVASLFAVTGKWQDFTRAAARMEQSLEATVQNECTPRPKILGNISVLALGKHFEGRPPALENVSFSIAPGERIALLGRPGAGKSTLLRCLAGLCQPDAGQILIDGLALQDISRGDRTKWLCFKGQDPALFAGTVEENLRISGCTEQNRFAEAIWASGLETEFKSGRMSLGMRLEERGSNLSGGQRQKVALARAFAQSCQILLLDEPTLGLDPESERAIAERLPQLLDSSTVLIMTTHSPIMLKTAQRVIALDGGRVVADGPREKLVALA